MDITPNKETQFFYGYCRESIDLESGVLIQKEMINKFCKFTNRVVLKFYVDNDSSAYEFRPKYDKMMEDIKIDNKVKGIICSNLSRFGRSTLKVLEAHKYLKDINKELILIKENADTTTPTGKLMFTMLAAFNDFEHDLIIERTHAGIEHAKKHGTKSGKPMHRPFKKIDWKQVDDLIAKKLSITSIAKIIGVTKKTMYNRIKRRNEENGIK